VSELKPGARLTSVVDETEVIVVKAPPRVVDLRCGGYPMQPKDVPVSPGLQPDPQHRAATQLGKRYADPATGLELLCTRGGQASLSLGGEPLLQKDAKRLPSSD